ncbi:MAG: hypothetical protein MRY21_07975 [Simkaniaceae bacterium]|nr:hypothetical protein [Simkaniaceae bacterium]
MQFAQEHPQSVFVIANESLRAVSGNNIIWLKYQLTQSDLDALNACEHFDLIHDVSGTRVNLGIHILKKSSRIHPFYPWKRFTVSSTYNDIRFKKVNTKRGQCCEAELEWIPGINLVSYLIYNGHHPSRAIAAELLPIDLTHTDWMPNNVIVQGSRLRLIDFSDPPYTGPRSRNNRCEVMRPKAQKLLRESLDKKPVDVLKLYTRLFGFRRLLKLE